MAVDPSHIYTNEAGKARPFMMISNLVYMVDTVLYSVVMAKKYNIMHIRLDKVNIIQLSHLYSVLVFQTDW